MTRSPFHDGERAIHERFGARERIESFGARAIRDFMPDQHRELFEKLPFLVVGALDAEARPWASIAVGAPGFVASPDARTLSIRPDVVAGGGRTVRHVGERVGLLGIELETRRRNRMNGTVVAVDEAAFDVRVDQSFGNCPKHIVQRAHRFVEAQETPRIHEEAALLGPEARALVAAADTFFLATASPDIGSPDPAEGVDVSHRGGQPGFVRVSEHGGRTALVVPDYVGNFLFNSFGNLARNPRAGLLFVDFARGDVLALTGEAEVQWEGPEIAEFEAAQRLLRFRASSGRRIEGAIPLRWSPIST